MAKNEEVVRGLMERGDRKEPDNFSRCGVISSYRSGCLIMPFSVCVCLVDGWRAEEEGRLLRWLHDKWRILSVCLYTS